MIISAKAMKSKEFDLSEDHTAPTLPPQPLPKLLDQPPMLMSNSILTDGETQKLKRLAEKARIEHQDSNLPPDVSSPAGLIRQESYSTEMKRYANKEGSYNLDNSGGQFDENDDDFRDNEENEEVKDEDDENEEDEDNDEDNDQEDTGSENDGTGSGGSVGRSSRKSDESHLTEPPLEGGFTHAGWSYQAYADRLERLERYPIEFQKLREDYAETRKASNESVMALCSGAKERRKFFATITGAGVNARQPLDESECHRLARDSVRRRYEFEKEERSHFAARDKFMSYVESILEEARSSKVERQRINKSLLAGPPGTPRAVEIGHEFITIEWNAPTQSAGDVMRYELSVLDLVEEGYDQTISDRDRARLIEEGKWASMVTIDRDFQRSSQLFTLNDLVEGGKYLLRVRALNCAGWGMWSEPNISPLMLAGAEQSPSKLNTRRSMFANIDATQREGWLNRIFEEIIGAMERNAAEFSELFAQLDVDNSGTVNRREVASGLKLSLNLVLDEDQLDLLLMEFDKDGNGEVQYDEFVDALEDFKFRSAISSKKKNNALKSLENFSVHSATGSDKQSMIQRTSSEESFDSDILRHSMDDFEPSEYVLWSVDAAKGHKRYVSGISHPLGEIDQSKKAKGGPSSSTAVGSSMDSKSSGYKGDGSNLAVLQKFEHLGKPHCRRKRKKGSKQNKFKMMSNQNDDERRNKNSDDDDKEDEEDEDRLTGENDVVFDYTDDIFKGDEDYEEMENTNGMSVFVAYDPLVDMPRSEVTFTLNAKPLSESSNKKSSAVTSNSSSASLIDPLSVKLAPDDLGRLVVLASRDAAYDAGVYPGFHLVRINEDVVWPPGKRRVTRKYVMDKMLSQRPITLVFEKCYPVKNIKVTFNRDDKLGFSLDQHQHSNLMFIEKVENGVHPKGLLPLDIIASVGGVPALSLEKHGVKGNRLSKLLTERPCEVEVIRGAPLHMALLPARSETNPDLEKKIIKKRIKNNNRKNIKNILRPKLPTQKSNFSAHENITQQRIMRKHKHAQKEFFNDDEMQRSTFDVTSNDSSWDNFSEVAQVEESSKNGKRPLLSAGKVSSNNSNSSKRASIFSAVKMMKTPSTKKKVILSSSLAPSQRNLRFFEVEMTSASLGAGIMDCIGCVEIISIVPNGEASKLGLQVGDLIMHINSAGFHPDKLCKKSVFLKKLMRESKPLTLGIGRSKEELTDDMEQLQQSVNVDIVVTTEEQPMPNSSCGMTLEILNGFAVVSSVVDGSPCAEALVGDTLIAVNRVPLSHPLSIIADIYKTLSSTQRPMILTFERKMDIISPKMPSKTIGGSHTSKPSIRLTPAVRKEDSIKVDVSPLVEREVAIYFYQKVVKYSALGIELKMVGGMVKVVKVTPYTPGHALGFLVDDVIVATGSGPELVGAPLNSPLFIRTLPNSLSIAQIKKLVSKAPRPAVLVVDRPSRVEKNKKRLSTMQSSASSMEDNKTPDLDENGKPIVFQIGDKVIWKSSDEEVPPNKVGTVCSVNEPEMGDVEVEYQIGDELKAFIYFSHRLKLHQRAEEVEEEEYNEYDKEQDEVGTGSKSFDNASLENNSVGNNNIIGGRQNEDFDFARSMLDERINSGGEGIEPSNTKLNQATGSGLNRFKKAAKMLGGVTQFNKIGANAGTSGGGVSNQLTGLKINAGNLSEKEELLPKPSNQPATLKNNLSKPLLSPPRLTSPSKATATATAVKALNRADDDSDFDSDDSTEQMPFEQEGKGGGGGVSNILVLMNMLSDEVLDNDDEYDDILDDVQQECQEFGKVLEVFIPRPLDGDVNGIGKIYVEFDSQEAALRAASAMKDREFGEQLIACAFLSPEDWDAQNLDNHTQEI